MLVDHTGKKSVTSIGSMQYVMVVKDEVSRYAWLHFILNKRTVASAFRRFVADVNADGIPSKVQVVRYDSGVEISRGS